MRGKDGRLTPRQVANAKPRDGQRAMLLADGGNLYLQVTRTRDGSDFARSWVFRYELDGRRREMGLGGLHTLGLAEARDQARSHRRKLLEGMDPIEARNEARAAKRAKQAKTMTFQQCAAMYISAHESSWKNAKHRAQWTATLEKYAYPIIGDLPVSEVGTDTIIKIIEPIWQVKTETAARLRGRIERVLDFATVREFRSGENPARWSGHLANLLPAPGKARKVKHLAALSYIEIPAFMALLRDRRSTSGRALEFTVLTAVRTGETIGAKWDEIDFEARTWTVPADRMKAEREHRVPLSDRAMAILEGLPRTDKYVFAGGSGRPLSDMAMLQLLRGMRPGFTVHGFRSTFRDWAAEQTNYQNHVVEMALAHTIGDKVEAAYRRGDLFEKRRRMMNEWARFCARPAINSRRDNIVEIRSGGAR
jgi:integrase